MTKWAKVRKPDEKYDNYQVPLYLDEASWKLFKEAGCQLKINEDSDGKYVTFKRRVREFNYAKKEEQDNGPPEIKILDDENKYVSYPDGLIGNGSLVTVRVDIYDTRNGKGHRLVSVGVNKLVDYKGNDNPSSQLDMPF
jgi:hypothetical protein